MDLIVTENRKNRKYYTEGVFAVQLKLLYSTRVLLFFSYVLLLYYFPGDVLTLLLLVWVLRVKSGVLMAGMASCQHFESSTGRKIIMLLSSSLHHLRVFLLTILVVVILLLHLAFLSSATPRYMWFLVFLVSLWSLSLLPIKTFMSSSSFVFIWLATGEFVASGSPRQSLAPVFIFYLHSAVSCTSPAWYFSALYHCACFKYPILTS